jgi:hypothetical protein
MDRNGICKKRIDGKGRDHKIVEKVDFKGRKLKVCSKCGFCEISAQ